MDIPLCAHLTVSPYDKFLEEELLGPKIGRFKFLEKLLKFAFQNTELFSYQTAVHERTFSPHLHEMG